MAIDGDTVVVGADRADPGGEAAQGAAYVFARSGSTWSQQTKLTAADGAADDGLGHAVSIDGNTTVIGVRRYASLGSSAQQGKAYAFQRYPPTSPWASYLPLLVRP